MAARREDRLEDRHIGQIISKLSAKSLKMVAITYEMGLEQHELEDISSAARDNEDQAKRTILTKWRNKDMKHNKPVSHNVLITYILYNKGSEYIFPCDEISQTSRQ